ncbi:MAG: M23 family metallopeptidase, partial [Thermodesulfobacteriota bacterium]|nr:M23 family metallopeptidase [Thermodesulfobacteriota bacterium]
MNFLILVRMSKFLFRFRLACAALAAIFLASLFSGPALGREQANIVLEMPIACVMGKVCSIQNYVDRDPGPGYRDYTCGFLTYDGHKGTDFRVPGLTVMESGVRVLAAAPGIVRAVRDGMADVSVKKIGKEAVKNREAGNAVVVNHGNGWETQ